MMRIPAGLRKQTGVDVGVNLALMQVAAHNSLTPELLTLDILTCVSCYGYDRYKDAKEKVLPEWMYWGAISMGVLIYIKNGTVLEALALLAVSTRYRNTKPYLGVMKPLFIGGLWSYAITYLPHQSAVDPYLFEFYCFTYTAASNVLDIKDIDNDRIDHVSTIPVLYGEKNALILSLVFFTSALFVHNECTKESSDIIMDISVLGLIGYCIRTLCFGKQHSK